ncbi:MAG: ABC transporter substrate-binding protein, partial [Caldisericia bacterium]
MLKKTTLTKFLVLFLIFFLNFNFLVFGYNLRNQELPSLSPVNQELIKYLENPPELNYGYIPPPIDLSYLSKLNPPKNYFLQSLPSIFDWRNLNGVTPIKDQDGCGTCWVFGTTSVLESKVKINESIEYDFSEQNVASCVDRSWVYLYDESDDPCMGGGWSSLASEVFIRKGATSESCDPYDPPALNTDGSCICKSCSQIKRVNGYRLVTNDQSQIDLIKQAIFNYGPITMAFYYNNNYLYYDPNYGYIYDCNNCSYANHLVSIVGWNDNVPHYNTPGTGAWIVKNSWGPFWGNQGYFYLAYNSSCMEEIAYLTFENPSNKELYLWDEAGWVANLGYRGNDSAWMAAVFTAKNDGKLTNVEFWVPAPNATYSIYVYDGYFGNNLLSSKSGTLNETGYYSIPLYTPINFFKNQIFTIQVKLTTPGFNYPIPIEYVEDGFFEPPIQSNKTFVRLYDNSNWYDSSQLGSNVCLRALFEPTEKTSLKIATMVQPNTLFPIFDNINALICESIIEPLIGFSSQGKPYPCLLDKIPNIDDGSIQIDNINNRMIVTYTLKENLYWSDGEPITSHDFYFTWQMMNNSNINVLSRTPYDLIYNVETPNDRTFITYWNYIDVLSPYTLNIYPSHILEPIYNDDPKDIETCSYNTNPIHAGPYKLLEWNNESIILIPNEYYYGDKPKIEKVIFKFYNDTNLINQDILNNQVDLVWALLSSNDIDYLKSNGAEENYNISFVNDLFWEHLTFNMDDPIVGDSNNSTLRKALSLAIDKQDIINTIYGGYRNLSNNILLNKYSVYYNPDIEDFQYNPTLARQILQDEGYYWDNDGKLHKPNGDLVQIIIKTTTRVDRGQSAQKICYYWTNNLGVQADYIQINPEELFSTTLPHRDFQVSLFAWGEDPLYVTFLIYNSYMIPTPDNGYNGFNFGGFINNELDILESQLYKISYPKNFDLLYQIQNILYNKLPDIPLYFWSDFIVYNKNLMGINYPVSSYPPITWNIEKWYFGDESPLTITTNSNLSNGFVNKPYLEFLDATGGGGFYKFELESGNLPPGLHLNQSGTIFGTPATPGGYTFSVKVTDIKNNLSNKQFTINILSYFKTLTPVGDEIYSTTDTIHISWDIEGIDSSEYPNARIRILLYTGGPRSDGLYSGWYPIAANLPLQDGSYDLDLSTLTHDLDNAPIEFIDPLKFRIRVGVYIPNKPDAWTGGWLTWTTPYGKTGSYYDETGHFWV